MTEPELARAGTKWWGWNDPDRRAHLSDSARALLRQRIGDAQSSALVSLDQVGMPEPAPLPAALSAAVGDGAVLTGREHRLRRAAGSSYPDLICLRTGRLDRAPDAVVLPGSEAQIAAVLEVCSREKVAVVPFGGGTSVVGGVDPVGGRFDRVIALDSWRLRMVAFDSRSLTARLGPGLRGPEAERELSSLGVTLGHFPQSFEYATIGGFAATRSAGQASSGYGRFDEIVSSIRMVAPAGLLATLATPHSAAGPALRELIVGSEGALGVITEVSARVRPAPAARRYEAFSCADFESGCGVVRSLAQAGALPDVTRVSDRTETSVSIDLAGTSGARRRLLDAYLGMRRRRRGCLAICGWEGTRADVERRRAVSRRLLRAGGAVPLGDAPGRAWERARFQGPYLRDELLDLGYLVETLETAHTWSRLAEHYRVVGEAITVALEAQGTPGIVMCHLSHAYRDGASLYFTFISASRPGDEIAQWRAVKTAACEAIVSTGGTITHHHAVGRDHAPYMPAEVGELGVEALRAVKERLDPAGVMNPGKLLESPAEGSIRPRRSPEPRP